jgi:hypothetical protein
VSPRHVPASVTELSRVGLFGSLPGEVLGRLADSLAREELAPGSGVEDGLVVVLSGMLRGRELHRPGTWALDAGRLTALTPAVVAHCDRATYDALIAPHTDAAG